MAIGFRSAASSDNSSSNTTITVVTPTGVVTGDVLIALCSSDSDGSVAAITAPSGWVSIDGTQTTPNCPQAAFYRIPGGSEPASYTFGSSATATSDSIVEIAAFTGVDTTSPINAAASGNSGGAIADPMVAPSVTATTGVGALVVGYSTQNGGSIAVPTGFTQASQRLSTAAWAVQGLFWKTLTVTGATGTTSSTRGTTSEHVWSSITIALTAATASSANPKGGQFLPFF